MRKLIPFRGYTADNKAELDSPRVIIEIPFISIRPRDLSYFYAPSERNFLLPVEGAENATASIATESKVNV